MIVLLHSCRSSIFIHSARHAEESKVTSFDWLLGDWQRTNDEGDMQTYESWQEITADLYQGIGFTMQNLDTVWQERINLQHENDNWHFDVIDTESHTTRFVVSAITPKSFTCVNPENEFPKLINYQRAGDALEAVISGGGNEVEFVFEPRNKVP